MIQKKVCMVGMFGTGKTSLVKRFVHSKFSEHYQTTIGVKVDRKEVALGDESMMLLLWDLAGRDKLQDVKTSYLKGSSGIFLVADGTRRETTEELPSLAQLAQDTVGDVPFVVALNKRDLLDDWKVTPSDQKDLTARGWHVVATSAKSGDGVESAFEWLAGQMRKPK